MAAVPDPPAVGSAPVSAAAGSGSGRGVGTTRASSSASTTDWAQVEAGAAAAAARAGTAFSIRRWSSSPAGRHVNSGYNTGPVEKGNTHVKLKAIKNCISVVLNHYDRSCIMQASKVGHYRLTIDKHLTL